MAWALLMVLKAALGVTASEISSFLSACWREVEVVQPSEDRLEAVRGRVETSRAAAVQICYLKLM